MSVIKFFLDKRAAKRGGEAPIKLVVQKDGKNCMLNVGIHVTPRQWDKYSQRVTGHPNQLVINSILCQKEQEIQLILLNLMKEEKLRKMSARDIMNVIKEENSPVRKQSEYLVYRMEQHAAQARSKRTGEIYTATVKMIKKYCKNYENLSFEDIDKDWLRGFDAFLKQSSPSKNARNIHFRNMRAIFNLALDDGITHNYPFRKFDLRPEPTRKRAVPVDELRRFFNYPVEKWQEVYVDSFKLMFCLIGINTVDLLSATDIQDGRLLYQRAKTHRLYDVKVEPEAQEIIDKYRGKTHVVCWGEHFKDYRSFTYKFNKCVKMIGSPYYVVEKYRGKLKRVKHYKSEFPTFTSYVARHSWATIAASLDIPKETIAHALGHGGQTVTDIYIDFDQRKVDEANRKVLDWVFYGKK